MDLAWRALGNFEARDIQQCMNKLSRHSQCVGHQRERDELEALLAAGYAWNHNIDAAIDLASRVLSRPGTARLRPLLLTVLRYGSWQLRRLSEFHQLPRPRFHHRHSSLVLLHIVHLSVNAAAEAEQLRLKVAERLAGEALSLSYRIYGYHSSESLLARGVLARVSYETGAVDMADDLMTGRETTFETHGLLHSVTTAFVIGAKVAFARGDESTAMSLLRRGRRVGLERGWPSLIALCAAEEIAMLVQARQIEVAEQLLEVTCRAADPDGNRACMPPIQLAACRLHLARQEFPEAAAAISQLRIQSMDSDDRLRQTQLTILLAGSLFQAGRPDEAFDEMQVALQEGARSGLFRTFIDEMPLIEPCLQKMQTILRRRLGHLNAYIDSLLSHAGRSPAAGNATPHRGTANRLSAKEAAILRLIGMGLSNKRIARELHIAPETVKSHAKRIFIKLSVKTRAEAVARGVECGVLGSLKEKGWPSRRVNQSEERF